ncbi:GreA/GreB family elongation factor [Candidatus Kuenenbacteria bacterium]|nr:GreA/GreB family elongation factor [Candidatus Kuenenbacteria bacterium]
MRVPKRRYDTVRKKPDPVITSDKYLELKNKLGKLKSAQPTAISEVKRLAEMGDFSDNAAYQMAKGKLRGINRGIEETEDQLNRAEVINPAKDISNVSVGHTVTIEINGQEKTYKILGSVETNPALNIISRHSPLGSALLGKKVSDIFDLKLGNKDTKCKIIKIG